MEIDLNADLGEGAGFDAELMPLVTSANVCCGLHAGGPSEIVKTLVLANQWGVAVGAHPGYADRERQGDGDQNEPEARHRMGHPEHPQQDETARHQGVAGAVAKVMVLRR